MPKFIDFHPDRKVPDQAIERLKKETTEGTYDEFGVRQLELYYNPNGGFYCLLEAPDAEAVRNHHKSGCGEILQVESLL